jgi:outer membrane protein W
MFRNCSICKLCALTLALTVLLAAPVKAQDAGPSSTGRALSAMNDSSPVGMLSPGERQDGWKGWFADAWEGSKRIFRQGHPDLMLPLFTFHPAYKYPNRHDESNYPWGVGFASTVIDEKDNERIVYALAFSDSHYDFQPTAGYAWIARWPLGAGLKGGLGYTVFVAARADANYIPFPAALPLASIGTDRVTLYASWIPSTEVLFFFARISLPFSGSAPVSGAGAASGLPFGVAAGTDGRFRSNMIYGAAALANTDAAGIDNVASGDGWGPLVGYKHFINERIALDVSASRSNQTLDLNNVRLGSFDLIPITLTAQYHFPSYGGLRMYAGAGAAYNKLAKQDLPGYALSSGTISPVLQAGASFPLTDALVLTGGMTVSFTRAHLEQDGTTLGTVKLTPAIFSLGLGYAF